MATVANDSSDSGFNTPEQKEVSPSPPKDGGDWKLEHAEAGDPPPPVSPEEERRLLRKLDVRIIPMICWVYLMNFMDRGITSGSDKSNSY